MSGLNTSKVYQIVTDRIIQQLQKGVIPWQKPWSDSGAPRNLVSKKPYRGMNYFLLANTGENWFLTFNQAKKLGGRVKKGASGYPVIFWKFLEVEDVKTGEIKEVPLLRYFTVFALRDVEGIDRPEQDGGDQKAMNPIEEAERIIAGMPNRPKIEHGGDRAFYRSSQDFVRLPEVRNFVSMEEYYSTAFHELVHSTGHKSRLARPEVMNASFFGDHRYSKEELVAEMGAAFLCGHAGFVDRTIENSAAYIDSWLDALRNDNKMLVQAAGKAQRAADFILNIQAGAKDGEADVEAA